MHSDIQMEFFKSQLSDFEHNIFKNEAGIYLAGCHCNPVILNLFFSIFLKYSYLKITTYTVAKNSVKFHSSSCFTTCCIIPYGNHPMML